MHVRFIFPKSSSRTEPQLSSPTSYTRPGPARGCCSERRVCRWSRCASFSPSPPPPAARRRLPGVSSSSSGLCSSPARLLPLSAAAQLGDSPAAAAALPPQYQHRNTSSAKPRERTKSNPVGVSLTCSPTRVDPFHGGRERAHTCTEVKHGGGHSLVRSGLLSCCSHLPNSEKAPHRARTRPQRAPLGCAGLKDADDWLGEVSLAGYELLPLIRGSPEEISANLLKTERADL